MEIIVCDRCEKTITNDRKVTRIRIFRFGNNDIFLHLCKKCRRDFKKFLKGKNLIPDLDIANMPPPPVRGTNDLEKVIGDVFDELRKAEQKHPGWPVNVFEQLAIIGEEFSELQQAVLQNKHEGGDAGNIQVEAQQVAAMALRFLFNLKKGNGNGEKTNG